MTTHVFIVDNKTFKVHLEHMFAGTGAKDYSIDFNGVEDTELHSKPENILVSMIADAGRIRKGDLILFYLQMNGSQEGKFYGVFKAKQNGSFLDNYTLDERQYLINDLGKSLTFRTLIEPEDIYSQGVTEWEALDEIRNITSPHQMLWSLIYRKLKANRGNTMITLYESERLCHLIRCKNQRQVMAIGNNQSLSFDAESQCVVIRDRPMLDYQGNQTAINIIPRLANKYRRARAFEVHLQAYITSNIGLNVNTTLDHCLIDDGFDIEWLGNEVSCGVGMQRMDVVLSLISGNLKRVVPIELKAVEAKDDNIRQVRRYIDWIEQYYIPNRHSDIQPVIIAKKPGRANRTRETNFFDAVNSFNQEYANRCFPIKYIEYHLDDDNIIFEQIL